MNYAYKIIRSNRKSVSVSVDYDNTVTVRCPLMYKDGDVQNFLNKKSDWIDRVIAGNKVKLSADKDIFEYRALFLNGEKYPIVYGLRNEITADCVYLKSNKCLKKLILDKFSKTFLLDLSELADNIGVKFASVGFKSYKRRWGCCDARNNVIFNFMIFMLPEDLRIYIAAHELCHILHHNHSAAFWLAVKKFLPNYGNLRKRLRDCGYLTSLY